MNREVHLELLLGCMVRSCEGAPLGRIQEIRAGERGEITEFLVGRSALLERLSALRLVARKKTGFRIRWDQIDISDPACPRLTCDVAQLEPF